MEGNTPILINMGLLIRAQHYMNNNPCFWSQGNALNERAGSIAHLPRGPEMKGDHLLGLRMHQNRRAKTRKRKTGTFWETESLDPDVFFFFSVDSLAEFPASQTFFSSADLVRKLLQYSTSCALAILRKKSSVAGAMGSKKGSLLGCEISEALPKVTNL